MKRNAAVPRQVGKECVGVERLNVHVRDDRVPMGRRRRDNLLGEAAAEAGANANDV